jgi:DNA-binding PadR family transcriptional regulator
MKKVKNMFGAHFQDNQRQSRLFKKGDLKYVILDIVKDCPSHGYDITTVLEDRFQGLYSPSAGSIYPILQFLENENYLTSCHKDGKNIYTITEEGKCFLKLEKDTTDKIKERFRNLWGSTNKEYLQDIRAVLSYSSEIHRIIGRLALSKDTEKVAKLKEKLSIALIDIKRISEEDTP